MQGRDVSPLLAVQSLTLHNVHADAPECDMGRPKATSPVAVSVDASETRVLWLGKHHLELDLEPLASGGFGVVRRQDPVVVL